MRKKEKRHSRKASNYLMSKGNNLIQLWKKKGKILEGIRNAVFKREDVENIAKERLEICRSNKCGFYDPLGRSEAAVIKGVESCGSCGCKLSWKSRSLSDACPEGYWERVLTETEEGILKEKLGMGEED
jgi:hypothetical protein